MATISRKGICENGVGIYSPFLKLASIGFFILQLAELEGRLKEPDLGKNGKQGKTESSQGNSE